jgi:hypothetical protein
MDINVNIKLEAQTLIHRSPAKEFVDLEIEPRFKRCARDALGANALAPALAVSRG